MRLPTLFKQIPNKKYNYTPRYYDERKERLEGLENDKILKSDEDYLKGFRRKNYRDSWYAQRQGNNSKSSNYRLAIILVILSGITYLILKKIHIENWF